MSVSCGCMDMWLIFLMLILLNRLPQQGSLVEEANRLTTCLMVDRHLKEMGMGQAFGLGVARRGFWSTGGKWTQRCVALAHAPIPDLTIQSIVRVYFRTNVIADIEVISIG